MGGLTHKDTRCIMLSYLDVLAQGHPPVLFDSCVGAAHNTAVDACQSMLLICIGGR